MHSTVSRFSRKCSNTFGVLKHFLFGLKSNYCGIDPAYRASTTSQCAAHNCRNIAISRTAAAWRICEMKLYDPTPSSRQRIAALQSWKSPIQLLRTLLEWDMT